MSQDVLAIAALWLLMAGVADRIGNRLWPQRQSGGDA